MISTIIGRWEENSTWPRLMWETIVHFVECERPIRTLQRQREQIRCRKWGWGSESSKCPSSHCQRDDTWEERRVPAQMSEPSRRTSVCILLFLGTFSCQYMRDVLSIISLGSWCIYETMQPDMKSYIWSAQVRGLSYTILIMSCKLSLLLARCLPIHLPYLPTPVIAR